MKRFLALILCLAFVCALPACDGGNKTPDPTSTEAPDETPDSDETEAPDEELDTMPETAPLAYGEIELPQLMAVEEGEEIAKMTTNYGVITLRFFPEDAPRAVENFITHAKEGYYDNTIFHRVVPNFAIQGGDPTGTGTGGESIWEVPFENEVTPKLHHIRGALSMANAGADTNGSQFFIVEAVGLSDEFKSSMTEMRQELDKVIGQDPDGKYVTMGDMYPEGIVDKYLTDGGRPDLDFKYSVFGQVIEGMDVVDAIANVEFTPSEMSPNEGKPVVDVVIEKIEFMPYEG